MVTIGDRIRLLALAPSPDGSPDPSWNKWRRRGDEGVVESITVNPPSIGTQIWVRFDDGGRLALLEGVDTFEIVGDRHD